VAKIFFAYVVSALRGGKAHTASPGALTFGSPNFKMLPESRAPGEKPGDKATWFYCKSWWFDMHFVIS